MHILNHCYLTGTKGNSYLHDEYVLQLAVIMSLSISIISMLGFSYFSILYLLYINYHRIIQISYSPDNTGNSSGSYFVQLAVIISLSISRISMLGFSYFSIQKFPFQHILYLMVKFFFYDSRVFIRLHSAAVISG